MSANALFRQITLDSETIGGGWKLYHYLPGTTTLKDVWIDRAKGTPAAQPIVADANGVVSFYADGLYDFAVYDAANVLKYSWANVYVAEIAAVGNEGSTLVAANTLTLGAASEIYNHVSGTTNIQALSGTQPFVILTFDSTPVLTDASTFQLRNRVTRQMRADETVMFVNDGGGVWREVTPVLRLPNNTYITGRNAAATAEINMFKVNATDQIEVGATVKNFALDADPTTALQVATKQYVDAQPSTSGFSTGDVKLTLKAVADTSWVLMNDTTIGDATSGATGRANADTAALYALLWNNVVDQWAPVSSGRGANAAADFAAHKKIALPKTLGRALAGYGTGVVVASGVDADVSTADDDFVVLSNNAQWITGMPVVFTLTSGTITGLTSGNTYYIIRESATLVQLASTLANAQDLTPINLTAKSSPVWTLTHTYTARALGETGGEDTHAMTGSELIAHEHALTRGATTGGAQNGLNQEASTGIVTDGGFIADAGGHLAMNNLQPTIFFNVMVKL